MNSFVEKDHSVRVFFVTNNHLVLVNFGGFVVGGRLDRLQRFCIVGFHRKLAGFIGDVYSSRINLGVAVAVVFSVSLSACLVWCHFKD